MDDDRAALGGWVREVLRKEKLMPTPADPGQQETQEGSAPSRTGISSVGPATPSINPSSAPTGRAPQDLMALLRSALEDNR